MCSVSTQLLTKWHLRLMCIRLDHLKRKIELPAADGHRWNWCSWCFCSFQPLPAVPSDATWVICCVAIGCLSNSLSSHLQVQCIMTIWISLLCFGFRYYVTICYYMIRSSKTVKRKSPSHHACKQRTAKLILHIGLEQTSTRNISIIFVG